MQRSPSPPTPWYAGVRREQWLVLAIASAGWVFDAFEGQVFNITRGQMLAELLGTGGGPRDVRRWGDLFLAVFLVGGTVGGVLFGTLADRLGRKPTMAATILFYSVFSGLTYFATELWHVAVLRFLVALGVGGEWAVAAALVAEVFPTRSRAHASGIFHATSVLGTWLAALAGLCVGSGWRYAYLIGVVPALLVFWVRAGIREPERRQMAGTGPQRRGSFRDLFGDPRWALPAVLGVGLAAVGLGTFWGVTVAGQDLALDLLTRSGERPDVAARRAKFAYGIVQTAGGGLGLLCFGPLAERLGRRGAFAVMHALALAVVPVVCYAPRTYAQLLCLLPVFGFFTLGIHAGYAVYFPELFPDHLRATGTGVCFNGGRLLAAPILGASAALKAWPGVDLRLAVTMLSSLFVVGLVLVWFLPETKGRPLPES
ncbi:MAG: MFS transporter [Planctomycetia bacterium]|nr:MFS transporter [Planctomycetia bacterium]